MKRACGLDSLVQQRYLEFLGTENRSLEHDVGPSKVCETGLAPSLCSCPFSFYHDVKGNTLPQQDGLTFLYYRWHAEPVTPVLDTEAKHSSPKSRLVDSAPCCFQRLQFQIQLPPLEVSIPSCSYLPICIWSVTNISSEGPSPIFSC